LEKADAYVTQVLLNKPRFGYLKRKQNGDFDKREDVSKRYKKLFVYKNGLVLARMIAIFVFVVMFEMYFEIFEK